MAGMLLGVTGAVSAQRDWNKIDESGIVARDTTTGKGFTLVFINKDATLDKAVEKSMTDAFWAVYPKEVKLYNKASLKKVVIIIDPEYKGVAATAGEIVRVNPQWMHSHPADIDVVTHEVMHIVQAYPNEAGPGWITEGIADYVRYTLGVDNAGANWKLPDYKSTQSYKDAYRVTARFFVWVDKQHHGTIKKLNTAMRTKTYTDGFWEKETGKTVDALWAQYAANPTV